MLKGPDIVLYAPARELSESLAPNPPRRKAKLDEEAWQMSQAYSGLLVRTALVRSADYESAKKDLPTISSAGDVRMLLRHLATADQEFIVTLAMNNKNQVVAIHETAIGGTGTAGVEARHVLKIALLSNGIGVIVVHNHPSGNPSPSKEDASLTNALAASAKCIGLLLVDHVIVASGGHWSFLEHGAM